MNEYLVYFTFIKFQKATPYEFLGPGRDRYQRFERSFKRINLRSKRIMAGIVILMCVLYVILTST